MIIREEWPGKPNYRCPDVHSNVAYKTMRMRIIVLPGCGLSVFHDGLTVVVDCSTAVVHQICRGPMFLESGVRCGSGERCRFQQNWFVLTTYCTLVGFAYSSALPSLHQFVTSSTHPEDSDVSLMHRKCQCTNLYVVTPLFYLDIHAAVLLLPGPGTAWSRTK